MIESKVDKLRRQKALDENRDISLRTMAREAGLAIGTVQKLSKGDISGVSMSTLDTLCAYFKVQDVGQVIAYVPAQPTADGHETPAG